MSTDKNIRDNLGKSLPNQKHSHHPNNPNSIVPQVVLITGPTAAGKTTLVHSLVDQKNDIIINTDSRQFYLGMDIGTAKPTAKERKKFHYKLLDFLSPGESISAFDFLEHVLTIIHSVNQTKNHTKHPRIFLVGGSMFYQQVIRSGLPVSVPISDTIKAHFQNLYQERGLAYLNSILKEQDFEYYQEVDIHNHRRVIRALEVIKASGKTFSSLRKQRIKPTLKLLEIAITQPRKALYASIEERVDNMFHQGWIAEVDSLLSKYSTEEIIYSKTIGYEEIITYLNSNDKNKSTILTETISLIKQKTRNMAKAQLNWIKKTPPHYLIVHQPINHDKSKDSECYPFTNKEDIWMNDFLLNSSTNDLNDEDQLSFKTQLLLVRDKKEKQIMLEKIKNIVRDFYE